MHPENDNREMVTWWLRTLCAVLLAAFAGIALISIPTLSLAGVYALILLSGAAVGVVLGFLFSVPRSPLAESDDASSDALLLTNTNLSKVSDWLTTMLVGVGLTQLHTIGERLHEFSMFLKTAGVGASGAAARWLPAAGPMLLIFSISSGFVLMYMHMRTNLVLLLRDAEDALKNPRVERQVRATARNFGGLSHEAVIRAKPVSIDDALNVMYSALYRKDGYKEVIDLAGSLSITPAVKRAEYWFYLAAAFGQQHHNLTDDGQKRSTRDNMLDAARRAVSIDPTYRSRLWRIAQSDGAENDLADFRDDPEFRSLTDR